MIALGVVLLILGFVFPALHILWTLGVVLLVDRRGLMDYGLGRPPGCRPALLVLTLTPFHSASIGFP